MSEICTLIESTNPLLKVKLSECSSDLDREKVESQLIDSMKHYQGIGLSANQLGIMERVFVMYSDVKQGSDAEAKRIRKNEINTKIVKKPQSAP